MGTGVGTVETIALTSASNARTTVLGLSMTNLLETPIYVSVTVYDPAQDVQAYFIRNVEVPSQTSLRAINGGERLVLPPSTVVKVSSSDEASMDYILSYVEII